METSNKIRLTQKNYKDLYLCFCGEADCKPLHSYGPAVKPSYVVHYIVKGKGKYIVNGHTYNLNAGEGFVIYPNILSYYEADENEPWSYVWVGFNGDMADNYLKNCGLSHNNLIFSTDSGDMLVSYVSDMLEHNNINPASEMRLHGLLYLFLSTMVESCAPPQQLSSFGSNKYIAKALEYIHNNYYNDIKISDIAEYVSLNRSYLSNIFSEAIGQSPKSYLILFRISRAAELLRLTDLSVADIARSCGYPDIFTFSKAFKKQKGISPLKFRAANRPAGKL